MKKILSYLYVGVFAVIIVLAIAWGIYYVQNADEINENIRLRSIPTATPTLAPTNVTVNHLFETFGDVFPARIENGVVLVEGIPYIVSSLDVTDSGDGHFIKLEDGFCFTMGGTYGHLQKMLDENGSFVPASKFEGMEVSGELWPMCGRWLVVVTSPIEGITLVGRVNTINRAHFGSRYIPIEEGSQYLGWDGANAWHYESDEVWLTVRPRDVERDQAVLALITTLSSAPEIDGPIAACSWLAHNWFALREEVSLEAIREHCSLSFESFYQPVELLHIKSGGPEDRNLARDMVVGYGPYAPWQPQRWFAEGTTYKVSFHSVQGTMELVEVGEEESIVEVILWGEDDMSLLSTRFTVPKGHYVYVMPYTSYEVSAFLDESIVYQVP